MCISADHLALRSEGTWGREARRVVMLAAELGVPLDAETLIVSDVRDLMALRLRLGRALTGGARPLWARRRHTMRGLQK